MDFQQRMAMRWSVVAMMALLAIASFLAAFYHRQAVSHVERSDWGRRNLQTYINDSNSTTLRCNGLSKLCDMPANQIVYATLHNANTVLTSGSLVLKNHVRNVRHAINAGYRGINFDIGKCFGEIRLIHGTCLGASTDLKRMLQQLVIFLDENPHEVLLLPTELTQPIFGVSESASLAEIASVFDDVPDWRRRLYNHPGPGNPWPTLRELIAADTRVVFFHYNGESCTKGINCPVDFHPWFQYAAETQFSFPTVAELQDKTESACQITRGGAGARDFFGVNAFVTPPRKIAAARVTNQANFLRRHLAKCSDLNGDLPVNLVLVNFWGIGDVLDVVREMNEAREVSSSFDDTSKSRGNRSLHNNAG